MRKPKYRGKQMLKSELTLNIVSANPRGLALDIDRSYILGKGAKLWDLCGMEVELETPSSVPLKSN